MCAKLLQSCLTLSNRMDSARQAPLFAGFSRQGFWSGEKNKKKEYRSGLPCPPSEDLPDPGMLEPASLMSPALAGKFFTTSTT